MVIKYTPSYKLKKSFPLICSTAKTNTSKYELLNTYLGALSPAKTQNSIKIRHCPHEEILEGSYLPLKCTERTLYQTLQIPSLT